MKTIQQKCYTRITLALDILEKLHSGPCSGFHELAVVKHQIDLWDSISVEDADMTSVECDDPRVPVDTGNICLRAVELVKDRFGVKRNAKVIIQKHIPVMSGLAGGSANAATALMLLNRLWDLSLSQPQLVGLGRTLGMDVPYFFVGGTAFDTESSGGLRALPTDLAFDFVLAIPKFGISTREAYANIDYLRVARDREKTGYMIEALCSNDRERVVVAVHNDFESTVFKKHPDLDKIKRGLLRAGACAAFMTGSGSTIVGIAHDGQHAEVIKAAMESESSVANVLICSTLRHGKDS